MARPIWKGDVAFGLVNIPITLYSAERRNDVHFRLLDSRDCAHVRYERVNEDTGEEVPWAEIVKGFEFSKGNYVVMKDEDFKKVSVEATKTIEIEDFVDRDSVDDSYFDKPYYIVPSKRGEKAYALFRKALQDTNKVGIARVVIRTRQYLAAVLPVGEALVVNLLRYYQELRKPSEFELPTEDLKALKITNKELDLSKQLIESMSTDWNPEKYKDEYREALMAYIEEKAEKGTVDVQEVEEVEEDESNVIDIMSLLRKSLGDKKPASGSTSKSGTKKSSAKSKAKKVTKKAEKKSS